MNNGDDDPAPYTQTDILSIQMLTLLRRVLPTHVGWTRTLRPELVW